MPLNRPTFFSFLDSLHVCSYISKVDVLKILVMANYKYIPSLDDILETSAVTRLRNQLLEAEHYQLAVEVRGRTGLRLASVFSPSHCSPCCPSTHSSSHLFIINI